MFFYIPADGDKLPPFRPVPSSGGSDDGSRNLLFASVAAAGVAAAIAALKAVVIPRKR